MKWYTILGLVIGAGCWITVGVLALVRRRESRGHTITSVTWDPDNIDEALSEDRQP